VDGWTMGCADVDDWGTVAWRSRRDTGCWDAGSCKGGGGGEDRMHAVVGRGTLVKGKAGGEITELEREFGRRDWWKEVAEGKGRS
jgi:hypothetical protein